jgi:hypothetical protein
MSYQQQFIPNSNPDLVLLQVAYIEGDAPGSARERGTAIGPYLAAGRAA